MGVNGRSQRQSEAKEFEKREAVLCHSFVTGQRTVQTLTRLIFTSREYWSKSCTVVEG